MPVILSRGTANEYSKSENEAINVENLVAFLRYPFEFFL